MSRLVSRSALKSCTKGVEASLLLQAVHAGRAGVASLDALVAAVLLPVDGLE
jgi:hypothetical protein